MTVLLKNNVSSTLATAISPTDTGIVVASGSRFPTITSGDYFYVTLVSQAGQTEIVKVTARVGNSMTVVRAQDGSLATSFQVGTLVDMRVNVASIADLRDEATEITITDAGGYYTSGTVEGALQEIAQDTLSRTDVTALLADTALTYSNVTAGDIVRTQVEGFAYAVAASGATNHHVTTAGGVKLYVQLSADNQVNIAQFGAVGSSSTVDTAAFLAFRAWALQQTGAVTLNLGVAKTYLVANPYWPRDILALTVNGSGSTIKNSATANVDKSLLVPSYGTDADGLGTFYIPVNRYALNTTTIGSNTVACSIPSEAGNFATGEWVMLASWDLQFESQPPNYRYFEYHEVSSVNAGTGVVTLRERVKYTHQSNFPYVLNANSDGRAHIYKIEQGAKWGIDHTYNDITFARNDVSSSGATSEAVYCQGRKLTFNRCTSPEFLPTVAHTIVLNNCTQTSTTVQEFDKLIEVIELNGTTFRGKIESATSVNSIVANNTTFAGGYRVCPKRLELIDCSVQAASQDDVAVFAGYGRMDDLKIVGGQHQFLPIVSITENNNPNVTLGVGGVTWTAATQILYVPLDSSNRRLFAARLYPGAVISTAVVDTGKDFSAGNFGIVRSVTGASLSTSAVVDWFAAPSGTEKVCAFVEPSQTYIDTTDAKRTFATTAQKTYELRGLLVTSGYFNYNFPVSGRPIRVVIDVRRAYTGTTVGNINLQMENVTPSYATRLSQVVDLKTTGRRERTLLANAGWTGTGGETASGNLAGGAFTSLACGSLYINAPTMAYTSNSELPIVDVMVEFEGPFS